MVPHLDPHRMPYRPPPGRNIGDWIADYWRLLMIIMWAGFAVWLLFGCATAPRNSFCDIEHATRLSAATIDTMTNAEVAVALAHNRTGEKLCGWKKMKRARWLPFKGRALSWYTAR